MKISVYITSYNQEKFLRESIESVLSQTLRPHEIIIIDDFSQDKSQDLINSYVLRYPSLIVPIFHKKNLGIAQSRTHALSAVTGDCVTYIDGDDKYLPTKLEEEVKLLMESPEKVVFSNFFFTSEAGKRIGTWFDKELPPEGNVFSNAITRDFPRGILFRCELVPYKHFREVGFYDSSLTTHEDWDLKIRLTKKFETVGCPKPLSEYRQHGSGLSKTNFVRQYRNIEKVATKNLVLLEDLPKKEKLKTKENLRRKVSSLARKAAQEDLRRGNIISAGKHYLKSKIYRI